MRGDEKASLVKTQRAPVDVPHDAGNMLGLVLGEVALVGGAPLLAGSGRLLQLAALGGGGAGLGLGWVLGAVVAAVSVAGGSIAAVPVPVS